MTRRMLAGGLMLLALAAGGRGDDAPAKAAPTHPGLERLKKLAGTWVEADKDGKPTDKVVSVVKVTAGGSAVHETLFPGQPMEMVSVYHLDRADLVMTHYCVLGNQPRMKADPKSPAEPDPVGVRRRDEPRPGEGHAHARGDASRSSTTTTSRSRARRGRTASRPQNHCGHDEAGPQEVGPTGRGECRPGITENRLWVARDGPPPGSRLCSAGDKGPHSERKGGGGKRGSRSDETPDVVPRRRRKGNCRRV